MKRLYWLPWIAFACLVWANPCSAHRGGLTTSISQYTNACGTVPVGQNWCVGTDGWTVFTATPTTNSGTCNSSATGTSNGTCAVFVSSTLSGASDSTCTALRADLLGITTDKNLNGFSVPTAANVCQTLSKAQTLIRNNSADWLSLKKGDTWTGGMNGATSDAWNITSGLSASAPILISAYGTGVRPQIITPNSTDISCIHTQSLRGQNLAITGISCYRPQLDPTSASFLGATIKADTGVANCGAANIICNINGGAGLPTNITGTNFLFAGNGINNPSPSVSITAGATSVTLNSSPSFTATQMNIQVVTKFFQPGLSFTPTAVNFLLIEDVQFNYAGLSIVEDTGVTPSTIGAIQWIVRRNMFNHQYDAVGNGGGANMFFGPACPNVAQYPGCPGGSILVEENVGQYGGWEPKVWSAGGSAFSHNWYLHNPNVAITLHGNINAYSSSDNQVRDSGTSLNNLFLHNAAGLIAGLQDNPSSFSYDVYNNGNDLPIAIRTATAASAAGSTTVSFDGATSNVSGGISDISNPGAIPNNGSAVGAVSATGITLSSGTVKAGIRGDGVQPGDTLYVWGTERSQGISLTAIGIYVNAGPATATTGCSTGSCYAPGSTGVTVSSATPAIVTEPSTVFARSQDEPFQFTAGTLPSGGQLALSTTYCADPANGSATAYPVYAATAGACTGGADINTTGTAGSGLTRTGSRLFKFATAPEPHWPFLGIPSWVTVGTSVCVPLKSAFGGTNNCTTVQSISGSTIVTADASIAEIAGIEQDTLLFGVPGNANLPTATIGPNNLFTRSQDLSGGTGGAISINSYTNGINAANNYIYNWDPRNSGDNIVNTGSFSGTNTTTQILNSGFTGTPDQRFPNATVEAYDAAQTGNSFTGTITGAATFSGGTSSSYDGGTLAVSGGTPAVGDTIFCASCAQWITVLQSTGTNQFLITAASGTLTNIGPVTMTSGSATHFLSQALGQSKESGWNYTWTARNSNNYMRQQISCGNQTLFPGSPACPQQNFLLKRDLDPASNDNSPMWLEKAA